MLQAARLQPRWFLLGYRLKQHCKSRFQISGANLRTLSGKGQETHGVVIFHLVRNAQDADPAECITDRLASQPITFGELRDFSLISTVVLT